MKKLYVLAAGVLAVGSITTVSLIAAADTTPSEPVVVELTPTPTPTTVESVGVEVDTSRGDPMIYPETPGEPVVNPEPIVPVEPVPTPTPPEVIVDVAGMAANSIQQLSLKKYQWLSRGWSVPYSAAELAHEPTANDGLGWAERIRGCNTLSSDAEFIDCMWRPWKYKF